MFKKLLLLISCVCLLSFVQGQTTFKTVENKDSINIPDYGPSVNLYPSVINISGLPPYLSSIQVRLKDVFHAGGGADIDLLLEAPNGERVILMSDIDFGFLFFLAQQLTFSTTSSIPLSRATLNSATNPKYKATNEPPNPDTFPGIGVIDQPNASLNVLEGINPNGQWKLYVVGDSLNQEGGTINGDWELTIFAGNTPICPRTELPVLQSVSDSSAIFNFYSSGSATKWDLYYGAAPLPPPGDDSITDSIIGQTEDIILSNLVPQKSYQLYIRSNCGATTGKSSWVGPVNFTTDFFPCKYAKPIGLHQRVVAPPDILNNYQIETCNGINPLANQVFRTFTPPTTGNYWLRNDGKLSEVYYLAVQENCGKAKWKCAQAEVDKHRLLGELSADSTYIILIQTPIYEGYNFSITACPWQQIFVSSAGFGPYDGTLQFKSVNNNATINGLYDIYYGAGNLTPPNLSTVPTQAAAEITNGNINFTQLTENTTYQIYLRNYCGNNQGAWQGPFTFTTERYCGDIQLVETVVATSSTASIKWVAPKNTSWEFYYRNLNPAIDTTLFRTAYATQQDTFTVYFDKMYGKSTYIVYAKGACGTSRQPVQGPFYFDTNDLCFKEPVDIECGQRMRHRTGDYNALISRIRIVCNADNNETIYRFKATESGTVYLHTNGNGTSGESQVAIYLNRPGQICDAYSWEHVGCWKKHDLNFDIPLQVQKDSIYHILIKGGGQGIYYDFYIKGCCNPPKDLQAQEINATSAVITWRPTDQERQWQLRWNIDNGYLFPSQIIENVPQFRITDLLPNTTYNVYVRALCSGRTSDERILQFTTADTFGIANYGVFNHSNPFFVRPEGEPDRAYFYEQISFSVAENGTYSFVADVTAGGGCRLLLYEAPFDPTNPTNGLLQTYESPGFYIPVKATASLLTGKEYTLIATTQYPLNVGFDEGRSMMSITGPAAVQFLRGKFNGRNLGPYGNVPPTSRRFSGNYRVRDINGWMHYYNHGENSLDLKDDYLLFSMQFDSSIYTAPRTLPRIDGMSGATKLTNPPTLYVRNPTGWYVMNRFWNLDLHDTLQPLNPVKIRFYFTPQDFMALRDTIALNGGNPPQEPQDLYFYKINDYDGRYNPNPALQHLNVPAATAFDQNGYWEYAPGDSATTQTWALGRHQENYYAEMVVKRFSGGGGGLAGKKGGALTATGVISKNNNWNIYPNPFSNSIIIEPKNANKFLQNVKIVDALGKVIYQKENLLEVGQIRIDLPNVPAGFYFLLLESEDSVQTFKLIKK